MFIFATFFSFQFQILLSMYNWRSFLVFLTILIFIVWIFQIDKLHFKFSWWVWFLNQFSLWLNSWLIIFLFFSNSCFDFDFLLRFCCLYWNGSLHRLHCLSLLTNSGINLSSLVNWLCFAHFFNNHLARSRSLRLWLNSDNLYLTGCLCSWFMNRFHNFYLFLLDISGCNWLLLNWLDLNIRLCNRLFSWFYNWFWSDRSHNRLWLRFSLFWNGLSNWLR